MDWLDLEKNEEKKALEKIDVCWRFIAPIKI